MRKLLIQLLLYSVIIGVIAPTAAQSQAASTETLIRNATVLTITRGTLTNSDVLIRNGGIAAGGGNLKASANARVIDGTNKYVISGLFDCHSHSMHYAIHDGSLSGSSLVRTDDVL